MRQDCVKISLSILSQVNDYLNNPPAAGTSGGSGRSSAGSALAAAAAGIPGLDMSNLRDSELQSLLNHMSQQQLMQLFGEAGKQSFIFYIGTLLLSAAINLPYEE